MSTTRKPPPNEELRNVYYSSLGNFIHLFALTEAMLRELLRKTAGVDKPTAMALFSGVRTEQAMSFIRRCYQARKQPMPAELESAFQQLAVIANFRNDVIHYGVDFGSDPPVATNARGVVNENAVRSTEIKKGTLLGAGHDLGMILLMFSYFLADDPSKAPADTLDFFARTPWHHKSAAPPNKGPKGRGKTRPASPRQPKASEG